MVGLAIKTCKGGTHLVAKDAAVGRDLEQEFAQRPFGLGRKRRAASAASASASVVAASDRLRAANPGVGLGKRREPMAVAGVLSLGGGQRRDRALSFEVARGAPSHSAARVALSAQPTRVASSRATAKPPSPPRPLGLEFLNCPAERGKALPGGQPVGFRPARLGRDDDAIPAPEVAVAADEALAGMEGVLEPRSIGAIDDSRLRDAALPRTEWRHRSSR